MRFIKTYIPACLQNKRTVFITLVLLLLFVVNPFITWYAAAADSPPDLQAQAAESNSPYWFFNFLGRLHPLLVHFPLSLLLVAAIMEAATIRNFNSKLRPAINILLIAGVSSALLSAGFGFLLANTGDYNDGALNLHQWSAIITTLAAGSCLALLYQVSHKMRVKLIKPYRLLLFIAGFGVAVAGHFGASLTHGADYLSSTLPWSRDYEPAPTSNIDFASLKDNATALTPMQEMDISMQVKTIFAHNCYKCHGPEKIKAELRLDSKKMIFKGGENGPVVVPFEPLNSELYKRITLDANHKEVMPQKGKKLAEKDITTIRFWIEKGAPWPAADSKENQYRVAALEPRNPTMPQSNANFTNPIDVWVNDYFSKQKLEWKPVVNDKTYLRRVYLDIVGLLPTPDALQQFESNPAPQKREAIVKELLDRNDDYALNWLTFWNDALRNDYTGTGYITGGRHNINRWLYQSLQTNKPYTLFVQELISPTPESKGFIEGIKWRGVINASQRTEMQAAQNVAQVFLGLNIKCASCHNSFISDWKLEDAYAFANIFSDTTLEINRCDKPTGKYTEARILWRNLGNINSAASAAIKQQQLARLITQPNNGRLSRTVVNRVWAQLMGRGLVEPVDLMDNAPWSQDVLDWLAYNFVQNGTDIKSLIYLITTSKTYQLPSVAYKEPNLLTSNDYTFTGMVKRRMTGEAFTDAVSSIAAQVFPDSLIRFNPFATVPTPKPPVAVDTKKKEKKKTDEEKALAKKLAAEKAKAELALAYGKITDGTLLLFPRASLVVNNNLLTALGRPNRETVSTSRESQASLLQALELTNGTRFNDAGRVDYRLQRHTT